MKPHVISISSSSDDDEENLDDEEEASESEFSPEEDGSDSESDDQEYDEEDEDDVESDDEKSSNNDDELRDRVIGLDQGKNDLQGLNLNECRAYLRKHQLRLSGTKEECIQRIREYWRLKDGAAEALYPRSSFSINCTGDACKGDVVFFVQKAYKKFDKMTRSGSVVGKRTVAGRIVKESYGTEKQQHTFTVEVLWSKGFKQLSPLSTLLVKGRNLYRYRTFRQPWKNEGERLKILGEKHKRGAAARHKRTMRQTKMTSHNEKGRKRKKPSSRTKQTSQKDKQSSTKSHGAAPVTNAAHKRKAAQLEKNTLQSSMPPAFHPNPFPPLYSHHHNLQASSSSFPHNWVPSPFVQYHPPHGHYMNGIFDLICYITAMKNLLPGNTLGLPTPTTSI